MGRQYRDPGSRPVDEGNQPDSKRRSPSAPPAGHTAVTRGERAGAPARLVVAVRTLALSCPGGGRGRLTLPQDG